MGLFIDEISPTKRPPVSVLAVVSLIVAATGFINIVGFLVGPVLAHIALIRLRSTKVRGRWLAIATLWLAYGVLILAGATLATVLIIAYAELPLPGQ